MTIADRQHNVSSLGRRRTYLLVLELDQGIVVLDNLVTEVLRFGEKLG
jgi:hypothetical protein